MGNQTNSFECSIPNQIFTCFLSFMDIFKGSSFYFDKFAIDDILQLVEQLDFNSLYQFINEKIPMPMNLVQALDFLSHSYSFHFDRQFHHAIEILIKYFDQLTVELLNPLSNIVLNKLFLSPKLIIEDENYLFKLITKLIEINSQRKELLKIIKFEFVSTDLLKEFFEKFPLD
jgi:hypothetical protein